MSGNVTERLRGVLSSLGVKAPVRVAATSNITLSGEQTIGSTAVSDGDRVLVVGQTNAAENGIYDASTSAWVRSADFDGPGDAVQGTLIVVQALIGADVFYQLTTPGTIDIGTTELTFLLRNNPNETYPVIPEETTAGAVVVNENKKPGSPNRYANNDPGVTDMRAAIVTANAVVAEMGGGTVEFEPEVYLLSAVGTYSVDVPAADANFQTVNENHQYHILLNGVDNVRWEGNGATLRSDVTNGGEMFLLDGVRNFEAEGFKVESVNAHNASGTVTTTGMNAFGFTAQSRDSYNIVLKNIDIESVFAGIYIFGDGASPTRTKSVLLENINHEDGIYTLACHNNGDSVFAKNISSSDTLREYFIYGVEVHEVSMESDTAVAGFSSIIKAYDRDTNDIKFKLRTSKDGSTANLSLQSQHAPGVQATPARLQNIEVEIDNEGNTVGTGVAVEFSYFRDAVLTASSSNNLFDGIVLKGIHEQAPSILSTQNGAAAARGSLNTDELTLLNGGLSSLYSRTGFFDNKQTYNTFTGVLEFGGSAAGITYSTNSCEWWRDGRWIEVIYRLTMSNGPSGSGVATLDLPIQSSNYNVNNAVVHGVGFGGMVGLTSTITGFVAQSGDTLTLQHQGAAGVSSLDENNFSNSSDILIQCRYPL